LVDNPATKTFGAGFIIFYLILYCGDEIIVRFFD